MTQLELSARIGLTRGSVANIEGGRQSVLLHQFLAIAAALQMEPRELLPTDAVVVPAIKETTEMPQTVITIVKAIRRTYPQSRR